MLNDGTFWEIGSTDLLGDTACLASLHVGSSELIEDERFASVDVTEDAQNGTS
jgi:hypothetical protein